MTESEHAPNPPNLGVLCPLNGELQCRKVKQGKRSQRAEQCLAASGIEGAAMSRQPVSIHHEQKEILTKKHLNGVPMPNTSAHH